MKWTYNRYQLNHTNSALKHITSLLVVFTLMSCLSTAEFTAANDVNRMDNNLTTLLIEASSTNNKEEKKQIAYLAALAHESADSMAAANSPRVAIAYYRMAAIGYWQDDIPSNDEQLLNVIDTASGLCDTLKGEGKAPDRDCFIIQVTLSLDVLESKFNKIAETDQEKFNDSNIVEVRRLLDEIGYQAEGNSAISQGFFVKFVSIIKSNADFLNNHPTMREYMVETLKDITAQYKKSMDEVSAYYRKTNNDKEITSINATHPLYKSILSQAGDTNPKKIENMINVWLSTE